jgi:hypothetical protein
MRNSIAVLAMLALLTAAAYWWNRPGPKVAEPAVVRSESAPSSQARDLASLQEPGSKAQNLAIPPAVERVGMQAPAGSHLIAVNVRELGSGRAIPGAELFYLDGRSDAGKLDFAGKPVGSKLVVGKLDFTEKPVD